jgi:hypothetical protein
MALLGWLSRPPPRRPPEKPAAPWQRVELMSNYDEIRTGTVTCKADVIALLDPAVAPQKPIENGTNNS